MDTQVLEDKTTVTVETNEENQAPVSEMDKVFKNSPTRPIEGDLVEGTVIGEDKMALYVDLKPFGTGIIYGREYLNAKDIIKKTSIGDTIAAKVVEAETENGYIGLSLREAKQALMWNEAEEAIKNKVVFELPIKDANKGGLLIEWKGLIGFLPASQLKPDHYPRVSEGNKDKIMEELKKLVSEKLFVSIIAASPKEGKLIFSEKSGNQKEKASMVEKYNIGDVLDGEITGAVDFGVFVKVEDGLEGLVHISEIDWSLVEDPRKMFKVGEKVKVKVIEIKDGKISLSIKALKENPWTAAAQKYTKGQEVKGVVIKHNKHGALVSIEEGVAGLVHVSEFGTEDELRKNLELGKTYNFKINIFEPNTQRMTLNFNKDTKKEDKK